MASSSPPKRGVAYSTEISLPSQANTKLHQTSVTLAAGDVVVYKDGVLDGNIDTLPVEIGTTGLLTLALSATEMDADRVVANFRDVSGAQWCDLTVVIHTVARNFDDLAYPTVSGRSLDVTATGAAGIDLANVENPTTTLNLSGMTIKTATDVETDTADIQTRIGTPSDLGGGASLAANLVAVEGQTDDIGVAGAGLTALGDTRIANLDDTISSRASQTSVNTIDDLLDNEVGTLITNVAAILADTGTDGVVVAAGSKAGYALSATGLDAIPMTAPTGPATTFREALVQTWRRWFKRSVLNTDDGEITTFADNGTTVITTQVVSDDGVEQVVGAAT